MSLTAKTRQTLRLDQTRVKTRQTFQWSPGKPVKRLRMPKKKSRQTRQLGKIKAVKLSGLPPKKASNSMLGARLANCDSFFEKGVAIWRLSGAPVVGNAFGIDSNHDWWLSKPCFCDSFFKKGIAPGGKAARGQS